jgi:hypothetical protein
MLPALAQKISDRWHGRRLDPPVITAVCYAIPRRRGWSVNLGYAYQEQENLYYGVTPPCWLRSTPLRCLTLGLGLRSIQKKAHRRHTLPSHIPVQLTISSASLGALRARPFRRLAPRMEPRFLIQGFLWLGYTKPWLEHIGSDPALFLALAQNYVGTTPELLAAIRLVVT